MIVVEGSVVLLVFEECRGKLETTELEKFKIILKHKTLLFKPKFEIIKAPTSISCPILRVQAALIHRTCVVTVITFQQGQKPNTMGKFAIFASLVASAAAFAPSTNTGKYSTSLHHDVLFYRHLGINHVEW